ncbi:CBS domain-containing protein [Syntrophus gentianae]|uniref:CBS domain-containing protein n=1 Tax=Syntrophus gentianae TaxID=43775 RepID=A0A1H7WDJ3_9BACT|nr:CBS domain-containing protein [Syntrophus gentianae]SEM19135.1 CBS domain-containing protein [Syntrophus gentianae]
MAVEYEPQVFLFLSQILRKKILDTKGQPLGRILDVVVPLGESYPSVTGILVKPDRLKAPVIMSWPNLVETNGCFVVDSREPEPFREGGTEAEEIWLKDSLLDKQIVDTNGAKVRRVNDLQFLKARGSLYLIHVDVGFRGLMRRVGLEKATDFLLKGLFEYELPDQFISWRFVQPLFSPDLVRLDVSESGIAQLHPADIADIIEELDIRQRTAVFKSLDVETAAETLEETDPKIQVSLIENMEAAQASDIIEEMSLSDAADLLADLPRHKAEGILKEMEQDIAEDVKELLAHPEETAGGLMTTAYLSFLPSTTVLEALQVIRREAEDLDFVYYLYVTDEEEHLLGMLSLRELLVASPETLLSDLMFRRVVTVELDEDKDSIASDFAKYGIMAIPVVDDQKKLQGVIMFKNLLDVVAPELGR